MIDVTIVEGRPAIVAYLNDRFEPVDEAVATLVKVMFTDEQGGMVFATTRPNEAATIS
jgi:hypothetical protein